MGVGSPGAKEDEHGDQASLPLGKTQVEDKGTGRRADLRLSGLRENERQAATVADGRLAGSAGARPFVMAGLCGGFTTFSAFSLQTVELIQGDETGWALAYALGSVTLCLLATAAGLLAGR